MGHTQQDSAKLSVEEATCRLEVGGLEPVVRAAYDLAGERAINRHGQPAAVLGAVRLASRRSRLRTLAAEELTDPFDVDPDAVVAAHADLAASLAPRADDEAIRSIRRALVVAHELLAAARNDRLRAFQIPDSYLADAAPWLLARANAARSDEDESPLDETALRTHVERLEADLQLARLGPTLYAAVHEDDCARGRE